MIVDRGSGKTIYIRYRNPETLERVQESISDVYPYCFVEDESAEYIEAVSKESGYKGIYGESLTKITMFDPAEIGKLAKVGKTWEANIPFVNRVLADVQPDIPDYKHRIWYLDGEWSVDTGKITILTVYDNYSDKLYTWFTHPDYKAGKHNKVGDNVYSNPAMAFDDERSLLAHFVGFMRRHDPDVITGWFVVGADIKQIVERCRKVGVDYKKMSPFNRIRYEFDDWAQPIPGRNCIDLMLAFTKLWEMKNGKLAGHRLDDVAEECLNDNKIPLPDGHNTYYSDFPLYLEYNRQDVELLPRLNSLNNAIEHFLSIQTIVKCDIRTTPFITRIFTCLALQDPEFINEYRIPTKAQFKKVDYEGADIQDADPNLYENVAIMDIKAMYHSNVNLHNISWETLDENGVDCGNGSKFNQEGRGLLGRQMDKMTALRNHYKALMKQSTTDEERRRYDALQYATKSLVASMYGCAGDSKYALYHPEIASAITYTSRQTLYRLRDECDKRGYPVIYGHTDSIFCVIPTPETGVEVVNEINQVMHPIETEFERFAKTMLISAKNRYAGMVNWVDGEYVEPQLYVKGMEIKQSRMPPIMRSTVGGVLTDILSGRPKVDIINDLCNTIESVMGGNIPLEDLAMKGKLTMDLSQYKSISGASAGAKWANDYLGKGYRGGDYFLCLLDDEGNYIAFDTPSEIPDWVNIGYRHIVERFIMDKVEPYFDIAGWSMVDLENARDGKSNVEWL